MSLLSRVKDLFHGVRPTRFLSSADYWEQRYGRGGTSGAGSYGRLAIFKAETINEIVKEFDIKTIAEFGCGDGNQLRLADYPEYDGYDVSDQALRLCRDRFVSDSKKNFFNIRDIDESKRYDICMSLDVIFHLIEEEVYEAYMDVLFGSSNKFVLIYSSNFEASADPKSPHVAHRKFSDWIEMRRPDWILIRKVENRYPFTTDPAQESFSDFYLYRRRAENMS